MSKKVKYATALTHLNCPHYRAFVMWDGAPQEAISVQLETQVIKVIKKPLIPRLCDMEYAHPTWKEGIKKIYNYRLETQPERTFEELDRICRDLYTFQNTVGFIFDDYILYEQNPEYALWCRKCKEGWESLEVEVTQLALSALNKPELLKLTNWCNSTMTHHYLPPTKEEAIQMVIAHLDSL